MLDWYSDMLATPDRQEYVPLELTPEQAAFVLRYYTLDLTTMKRRIRRAVISRSKGWGKSPLLSAIGAGEALGPVVFDGFDARGEPVGKPWREVRTAWVQFSAVSEDQTRNSWGPLLEMLREGPAMSEFLGLDPMDTFVALPGKGRIEYVTSSSTSREGNRPVWALLDQTEEWKPSNGGIKLAATIRRNLGKTGGSSIEAPNAFEPGAGSVAEKSAEYASRIAEGKGVRDRGLLYDHREAPPETDMADRVSLLAGLAVAYGDSAEDAGGWVDLERIAAECWDPDTDVQDARRFYLNQITHASDSWLSQPEWGACLNLDRRVIPGEPITLGFDGSIKRQRGVTDATALIGCCMSDSHLFEIATWEQPDGPLGDNWEVPKLEVQTAVDEAFRKFGVVAFFADPAKWETYVAAWEAKYHKRLKVKASHQHPIEWWMTGRRSAAVVQALDEFHTAVVNAELSHDGSLVLTRHVLNARRRSSRSGIQIAKASPDSPKKIDAAVAAVLAVRARREAIAAGATGKGLYVPRRLR